MEVVVIHILAQGFGHCPVALIGVHHSGEDILLAAHNLHGCLLYTSIAPRGFIGKAKEKAKQPVKKAQEQAFKKILERLQK